MVFGWCFLRDTWSESVFERDWLVLYLALNKTVVGLNRIDSVSKTFTGEYLRKILFLARAALGIVQQGTLPVLCVCSSVSAGVPISEWINKGEGWPCLERGAKLVWLNAPGGCCEGCSFGQNSLNISPPKCPSYAELTVWNWFEKLLKSVFDRHHVFIFKLLSGKTFLNLSSKEKTKH